MSASERAASIELQRGTTYITSDLYLGSFLYCRGAKLLKTTLFESRVSFVFDDPNIQALWASWFDGTGEVVAAQYAAATRDLKQLVRSRRED